MSLLSAKDVAALLSVSRSTFYTLRFFRERAIKVSARRVAWTRADVDLYLSLRSADRRAA